MRRLPVDTGSIISLIQLTFFIGTLILAWYVFVPIEYENSHASSKGDQFSVATPASGSGTSFVFAYQGRYMVIDIPHMRLKLYNDTELLEEYPIVHVPKDTSPLSLKEGTYSVEEKVETEASTVAMVRFPYFIPFGDTYAIHGTPTDADGTDLLGGYVGGQVELSHEDAERLYTSAEVGMPVYVLNDSYASESEVQTAIEVSYDELPATSARSYALIDLSNQETLLSKNENAHYPIASITKLVAALVAVNLVGYGTEVEINTDEHYLLSDLYYPLLLRSNNTIAHGIARHVGWDNFVTNMNAYVHALGMSDTSFADSSGLSPQNISTAHDLGILAHHLYDDRKFLLDITKEEEITITSREGDGWNMENQNLLAYDPYFQGGKLGYTDEAGQTSLSIFALPVDDEVRIVAVIVLNARDWKQDTRTLLTWLEDHGSLKK